MARARRLTLIAALIGLILGLPVPLRAPARAAADLREVSVTAGTWQYLLHPEQAPADVRARFSALAERGRAAGQVGQAGPAGAGSTDRLSGGIRFNRDGLGLPQNEPSVAVCAGSPGYVLGGANDYRGIVAPQGGFTGWYLSADGGRSVRNEGLLPPIDFPGGPLHAGGDPVDRFGAGCSAYATDLNYDFSRGDHTPGGVPNGIGIYRSDASTLAGCPRGSDPTDLVHPECWPTRRMAAVAAPGHFLDKEWLAVGRSGAAGEVVWIAYGDQSQFDAQGQAQSVAVMVVRCDAALIGCTDPIAVSEGQQVAAAPTVNIAPDGTTVLTWAQFQPDGSRRPWIAVAPAGSTAFTSRPVAGARAQAIGGVDVPHAAGFRFNTIFTSAVTAHAGRLRVDVVWAECLVHVLDTVCEEPRIFLTSSADLGLTWSAPRVVSAGADNFLPALAADPVTGAVVAAWYTTRFDPLFHHRYDVELLSIGSDGSPGARTRVTTASTEPDADPLLSVFFIGDYFEVAALRGTAYVHFNGSYRPATVIGAGVPVPQQDNYLALVPGVTAPGRS
jgi:hypothetical protein